MRNTQSHSNQDPVVEVRELTRVYGLKPNPWALTPSQREGRPTARHPGFTAVDRVSFHVNEGEVYGLLGTNGAGKSSTLEVIEGLARPTSGEVRLFGKDPAAERRAIRPQTGIMLQRGGLPQELTVLETLKLWAGISSHPRPVDEVLEEVGLGHRRGNKVGGLSGGEQRRLDLACALLNDPKLIFLDEPTTGLDPESRYNTWELLRGLKERGVTMILTTHYLEEAEHLCDRIAIMHEGRIQIEGTLADIVSSQPSHITFTPKPGASLPPLPERLRGAVLISDSEIQIASSDLQADALEILRWADTHGLSLGGFSATPASLDNVFLSIAGR